MPKIASNILEAIGHTPMVRINRITRGVVLADVAAKIETFNPGNSIKDRMAVKMIEDAEKQGLLKPGGTIIEGTSGNTGMGLAIAAVVKGYKCVFTTTDKQSNTAAHYEQTGPEIWQQTDGMVTHLVVGVGTGGTVTGVGRYLKEQNP